MSRATEVVIGSARAGVAGEDAIRELLGLTGAEEVSIVSRSDLGRVVGDDDDDEEGLEILGYDVKSARVQGFYRPGACLELDVGSCPLSKALRSAARAGIADDVLDEFSVNGVFLRVGEHSVEQIDEEDNIIPVGRYLTSLTVWGYGTPVDPDALLAGIRSLTEFVDLLARFEAEFGPAQVSLVMRF